MSERLLRVRKEASRKRPTFRRQETWKLKRFKNNVKWRKPRGHSSKMRRKLGGKAPLVSIGYRGPKEVRYFHPCGLPEVKVSSMNDLVGVKDSIVRISASVGTRKKADVVLAATEAGLRIANPKVKFVYLDSVDALERYSSIKDYVTEFKVAKVADNVADDIESKAEELKVTVVRED